MKARVFVALLVAGTLAMPVAMSAEKVKEKAAVVGKGFAGMIAGKVTAKDGDKLIVEVTKVEKTWKHSKLENADSLVGQKVTILPAKKSPMVGAYAAKMNAGDTDVFDVRQDGPFMVWLELTGDQRKKNGDAPK